MIIYSMSRVIFLVTTFKLNNIRAGGSIPEIGLSQLLDKYIFGALLGLLVLLIIYGLYISAYIKRYYYDSTDFITIKKGVFTPTEIHVQYKKIQDVYVDQDLLDRFFGIYDVHIASATYTSGIEAHIDGVDTQTAEALKNYILAKIQNGTDAVSAGINNSATRELVKPVDINFSEEISSNTFPIDDRWYMQVVFSGIISSIILTILIVFVIFGTVFLHYFSLITNFIVCFILFAVLLAWQIIYSAAWKGKFYFAFQPQFIMQKTGVITSQEIHLPYKSIQDVIINQSFFEKVFGLCTVTIQNAVNASMVNGKGGVSSGSSGMVLVGQPLEKGQRLVEELNKVLALKNDLMGL
ncbi:MAG TPA: PH domain-containing protein [Candidatus Udaeobacter sp.]|nr:PH domain-containing protein [Candidatus Udaeobacter sp.]